MEEDLKMLTMKPPIFVDQRIRELKSLEWDYRDKNNNQLADMVALQRQKNEFEKLVDLTNPSPLA